LLLPPYRSQHPQGVGPFSGHRLCPGFFQGLLRQVCGVSGSALEQRQPGQQVETAGQPVAALFPQGDLRPVECLIRPSSGQLLQCLFLRRVSMEVAAD